MAKQYENERDTARELRALHAFKKARNGRFYMQTEVFAPFDGILVNDGWWELVDVRGVAQDKWERFRSCLINRESFYANIAYWMPRLGCSHYTILTPVIGSYDLYYRTFNPDDDPTVFEKKEVVVKGTTHTRWCSVVPMENKL